MDKDYDAGLFYLKIGKWQKAIEYFIIAEENGHPYASKQLGNAYLGYGLFFSKLQRWTKAYNYLEIAANLDNPDAQFIMYLSNTSNMSDQNRWINRAAAQGHKAALERIKNRKR